MKKAFLFLIGICLNVVLFCFADSENKKDNEQPVLDPGCDIPTPVKKIKSQDTITTP